MVLIILFILIIIHSSNSICFTIHYCTASIITYFHLYHFFFQNLLIFLFLIMNIQPLIMDAFKSNSLYTISNNSYMPKHLIFILIFSLLNYSLIIQAIYTMKSKYSTENPILSLIFYLIEVNLYYLSMINLYTHTLKLIGLTIQHLIFIKLLIISIFNNFYNLFSKIYQFENKILHFDTSNLQAFQHLIFKPYKEIDYKYY